jgi:hypothetical protein
MAAPAAPVNPLKDRLDAQWENRPRFDYANNGAPIEETRPAFNRFSDADLSGGPLNMPRGFGDVAPQGLPKGNGFLADDRGIEEDFNTGVTNLGFVNQPVTAPGYAEPPEGGAGFGAVAPAMQSEPAIANEMPVRPISNMPAEAPVRPIRHSAPHHAAPHRATPAMGSPAAPEPGFGFDIGDLFGDEQPGSGLDLGDLFKDVEFDLPNLDLGALFNRGGAVRAGYDRGGRIGAKEAFEYLTKELGATPAEAEVLIPAAAAESGFNPQAVHDQGTGYGLFGHRLERRDAMRKSLGEEVSDPRRQFGFALDEFRHRPEHRYVEGENPSLEDIMMAHGAFERPAGYREGHPEGMKAYDTRRGLTEAMLKGDFGAFENIKGLGGSGESVVAADRGEGPSSLGGLKGFLQDNRGAISDISDFLLASGFGAMASRNPNLAGALGEGGLRGIEALNAARTSRNAAALQELQAQNLMSEVTKRNFELSEAMRQQRARQGIAGGAGGAGAGAGSEGALPPSSPPAPKIVSEAPAEEGMEAPKVAAAPQAAPEEAPIVAAEPMPVVTPQEDLSRRAPPEYRAETYEREMAEARAEELAATRRADQSRRAGLLQDAKDYEAQAKAASERRMKAEDSARKARETPFPIAGEDLKKDYEATQSAGRSAQDKIGKLEDLKANLESPDVYTGFGGEQYLEGRKAVEGASELIPPLGAFLEKKGMRPSKEGIAKTERVAGQAAAMLKDTVGSLGNGTSNADVALVSRMGASISQSKEGNIKTVNAAIRAQVRAQEVAEFQRRYIAERGGLDANYNTALKKWAEANPMFDREGNPTTPSLLPGSGGREKSGGDDRKVVRTGKTKSGKSVKQYSDGTIEYGD